MNSGRRHRCRGPRRMPVGAIDGHPTGRERRPAGRPSRSAWPATAGEAAPVSGGAAPGLWATQPSSVPTSTAPTPGWARAEPVRRDRPQSTVQLEPDRSSAARSPGPPLVLGLGDLLGHLRRRTRGARRPGTRRSASARRGPGPTGTGEGQAGVVAGLVVDQQRVLAHVGHRDDLRGGRRSAGPRRARPSAPKRIGWPCTSGISMEARASGR